MHSQEPVPVLCKLVVLLLMQGTVCAHLHVHLGEFDVFMIVRVPDFPTQGEFSFWKELPMRVVNVQQQVHIQL